MISPILARRLILGRLSPLPPLPTPLEGALGQVLADDLLAPINLPPFDHSAMDGFALKSVETAQASPDTPLPLLVTDAIAAGDAPHPVLGPGTACRIMTGGMLPPGADAVVPIERVRQSPGGILLSQPLRAGEHVRRAGEDVRKDRRIMAKGDELTPARLALLASLGFATVPVHRRPKVAILTTGNELVPPGQPLRQGQIYDCNTTALVALVQEAGCIPVRIGGAPDDPEATAALIQEALQYDLVITAGGVSVGDFDFVGKTLAALGQVHFNSVAQQPGKPMTFATVGKIPVFALPGTPVAVLVTFEYYVRPALRRLLGHTDIERPTVSVRLCDPIQAKPDRQQFLRAVVHATPEGYQSRLVEPPGTKHLSAMAFANALLVIPPGVHRLAPGESVPALLLEPAALIGEAGRPPDNDTAPLLAVARRD